MRWLKSLVILLGVLIVAGLVLLGYGFIKKSQNPDWRLTHLITGEPEQTEPAAPTPAEPAKSAAPLKALGEITLDLPTGCSVTDVDPDGRRAYLTIGPPGPCHRVVIIDVSDGRVIGTVRVSP